MNQTSILSKKYPLGDDAEAPKPTKAKGKVNDTKSLRDEFAMASLDHATSIYSKMTVTEIDRLMGRKQYSKDQAIARLAYNMADAMIEARAV